MTITDEPTLLSLLDPPPIIDVDEAHLSLDERFDLFVDRNPHIVERLETLTGELIARGHKKFSIKMLIEVLRWQYFLTTDDPSCTYRINNDYSSRFARLLMDRHPAWEGVFEVRALRSAAA